MSRNISRLPGRTVFSGSREKHPFKGSEKMKYLIAALICAMVAALSYICLDPQIAKKIKIFEVANTNEKYADKNISKRIAWISAGGLAVIAFFATLTVMKKVSDPIGIIKMLVGLVCMVGAACFDFREYRIPNIFPLVMTGSAVILLVLGVIVKEDGAISYITTSVITAVACAIVLVLASLLTKQGIGAGDIKLISALGLLTGMFSVMGTLFFGVVACSLFAIGALITRKKDRSSGVPFGPFLLLGYIITLFAITF